MCISGTSSRDPAAYFFSSRVQELLFQLNDRQHDQVFRPRKLGQKLEAPQYVFMTEEDLHKVIIICYLPMHFDGFEGTCLILTTLEDMEGNMLN